MERIRKFKKLLRICIILYNAHTLFMLTDMKSIKQNGIIRVKSMEELALEPRA
jgi:hypothetical protein